MNDYLNYDVIIWGITAGIVIAAIISYISSRATSKAVKNLLDKGAFSPDTAITAEEAEIENPSILTGTLYGKIFVCANEMDSLSEKSAKKPNPYKRPKLNMDSARFFIPEEKKYEAEARFADNAPKLIYYIVGIIITVIFFGIVRFFAPKLVTLLINSFTK